MCVLGARVEKKGGGTIFGEFKTETKMRGRTWTHSHL